MADIKIKFTGDSRSFDKSQKKVEKGLETLGKTAGIAALAVGAVGLKIGADSVAAFSNFDDAMTKSTAIMGDLSDDMRNDMSDAAREIGKTTRFAASEAAEGFFFLASAGLDAEESLAALPKVAEFATAGMFDLATATDLVTDAQSALGLSVEDSEQNLKNLVRVSDVLVKANTLSNATVEQFSEAITNKAGAAMRDVNMDIESGAAVLAVFADQGVKGAYAGTLFSIVLRDMQTKAIANGEAFSDLGVSVFDAKGNFNNMGAIIGDLEDALDGLSDKAKKQTLLDLGFTDKSIGAVQALLGSSSQIVEYEKELYAAAGVTEEIAAKQLDSFAAKMDIIKSQWEDMKIEIGGKIAPHIIEFFDKVQAFKDEHGPGAVERFEELRDSAEEVGDRVGNIEFDEDKWDKFRSNIGVVETQMDNAFGEQAGALWESFKHYVVVAFSAASDAFWAFIGFFSENKETISGWVLDSFGEDSFFASTLNGVMRIGGGVIDVLSGLIAFVSGVFTGDWDKAWAGVLKVWEGWWNIIRGIGELIFTNIWSAITAIPSLLLSLAPTWFEAAKSLGGSVWGGIKDSLTNGSSIFGVSGVIANQFKDAIKGTVNKHVIDKMNRALEFDINFMGRVMTINPPDIPHLATGGYVKDPTLAVVGDTIGEGEIVSPESMMKKIVREETGKTLAMAFAGKPVPGPQGTTPLVVHNMNIYGVQDVDALIDEINNKLADAGVS